MRAENHWGFWNVVPQEVVENKMVGQNSQRGSSTTCRKRNGGSLISYSHKRQTNWKTLFRMVNHAREYLWENLCRLEMTLIYRFLGVRDVGFGSSAEMKNWDQKRDACMRLVKWQMTVNKFINAIYYNYTPIVTVRALLKFPITTCITYTKNIFWIASGNELHGSFMEHTSFTRIRVCETIIVNNLSFSPYTI